MLPKIKPDAPDSPLDQDASCLEISDDRQKERGAGRHPMIRVTFNGKSELITASLTSPGSLLPLLSGVKRALRNLGALKDRGPGERRRR